MYHPSYPFESLGLNSFMYAGPSNDASSTTRTTNSSISDTSDPILLTPTTLTEDVNQYYEQQLLEQPSSCIYPFDISFDIAATFDEAFFTTPLDATSAFMTPSSSSSSSSSSLSLSSSPSPKMNYSPHNDYTHVQHQQHHTSSYHQDYSDFSTPYHFETPPPPSVEEMMTTPQMTNISFELDSEDEQMENEDEDSSDDNYMEDQQSIQFEEEDPEDDLDWPASTTTDTEYEPDDHVYTKQPRHSPTVPSSSSAPKTTIKKTSTHNKSVKRWKEKRMDNTNNSNSAATASSSAEVTRCSHCDTLNTPLWRRNLQGLPLCNACGLFLKLHGTARPLSLKTDVIKKRNRGGSGSLSSSTSKRKRSLRAARKGSKKRSK